MATAGSGCHQSVVILIFLISNCDGNLFSYRRFRNMGEKRQADLEDKGWFLIVVALYVVRSSGNGV